MDDVMMQVMSLLFADPPGKRELYLCDDLDIAKAYENAGENVIVLASTNDAIRKNGKECLSVRAFLDCLDEMALAGFTCRQYCFVLACSDQCSNEILADYFRFERMEFLNEEGVKGKGLFV